jgi:large subunit ribosomal protein L36e
MSDTKAEATKTAAPKKAADSTKPAKAAKPAATTAAATKPAAAAGAKKAAASSATKKKEAPKKAAAKKQTGKVAHVHNTPAKKRYMVAPVRLRVKVAQEEKLNQLRHLQRRAPRGVDKKILKKKGKISPKKAVLKRLAAENLATQQKIAQKEKDKVARAAGKFVLKKQKTQQPKRRTLAPKSKKPKKKEAPKAATTEAPKTAVDPKEKLAQIFKKKKEQRQKRNQKEKQIKQRLSTGQQLFISSNPEKAKKKIEKKLKSSPTSLSEYALKKKTALTKIHSDRSKVFAKTGKYPPKPTKEELKAAIAAAKPAKMPQYVTKAAAAKKAETEEYKKKYALNLEKKKKKKEQAKTKKAAATKEAPKVAVKKEKKAPAAAGEAPKDDATAAPAAKTAGPAGPKNVRKPHHKYEAIAIGKSRGYQVTKRVPPPRQARRKGVTSRRVRAIKDIIREVSGFTPYEKRIMELLRNNLDKRALKFAKRRLGTHGRAKKKREEMQGIIQKMRAT